MAIKPSLSITNESGNEIRALKSDDASIALNKRLDKLSLWTLASDVKTRDDGNLEDYYDEVIETASKDMHQHEELVELLRDMGSGVSMYSTIDKISDTAKALNSPIIEALEDITGESVSDTTTQGIINHIQRFNTEFLNTLDDLEISATGIQGIISALDNF